MTGYRVTWYVTETDKTGTREVARGTTWREASDAKHLKAIIDAGLLPALKERFPQLGADDEVRTIVIQTAEEDMQ